MTELKAGHLIAIVEFPQVQNSTHVQICCHTEDTTCCWLG